MKQTTKIIRVNSLSPVGKLLMEVLELKKESTHYLRFKAYTLLSGLHLDMSSIEQLDNVSIFYNERENYVVCQVK